MGDFFRMNCLSPVTTSKIQLAVEREGYARGLKLETPGGQQEKRAGSQEGEMGTGPLLKMESAGRRGKEIVPTRSLKEIMSPWEPARITQMSDFLKLFAGG